MTDQGQTVADKIARVRAAIALEPHDRVPLVASGGFWPVRYAQKHNMQEAFYNVDVLAEGYKQVFARWNSWDAFNASMQCMGPVLDAAGSRRYHIPGRELSPDAEFQYPDISLMSADEYPELIKDPVAFHAEKLIPRLCTRLGADDPYVRLAAWNKTAIFFTRQGTKVKTYTDLWRDSYGIPRIFQGQPFIMPMDYLADCIRGFRHGLLDIKQRPQEVTAACEAMTPFIVTANMATGPAGRDYPLIFNPQHVSPFISPKDYDRVYWPTFKRIVDHLAQGGYKLWAFLESNQEQHLEHLQDLPKGKVVVQFESTDLAKARKALGGRLCIAGGMPSVLLARGTPQEVRDQAISVLKLFEDEPGFIMTSSTTIPITARPDNITAWLDAVRDYGSLTGSAALPAREELPRPSRAAEAGIPIQNDVITHWEDARTDFGEIKGDEGIIKKNWEQLENLHISLLHWLMK